MLYELVAYPCHLGNLYRFGYTMFLMSPLGYPYTIGNIFLVVYFAPVCELRASTQNRSGLEKISRDMYNMASLLNSKKDVSNSFIGQWEDVKDYTSAIITLKAPIDGSATVQWAHTDGRAYPTTTDIIASERFSYSGSDVSTAVTKQFDHRARWFRVVYDNSSGATAGSFTDMSLNFQTLYKKAPTELKIVDDSANIVSVNVGDSKNSLYTMITDASGVAIRTTNDQQTTGEALFTHLADSSGASLATTSVNNGAESLFVALRDASNIGISSTGTIDTCANALYVRPGDASGNAQASTFDVSGAYTAGVALYAALADNCGLQIDTTNMNPGGSTSANALYVHLALEGGISIDANNPLPVVNTQESIGALAFDISYGVQTAFISPLIDLSQARLANNSLANINLYNIFIYNDSPTTVWVKVYDLCYNDLSTNYLLNVTPTNENDFEASLALLANSGNPKYNLTVPGGRARDLVLPGGATFINGVYVRATTQYKKNSVQSPGPNTVFLNGSYTKEAR
jgi:hypothetical protein